MRTAGQDTQYPLQMHHQAVHKCRIFHRAPIMRSGCTGKLSRRKSRYSVVDPAKPSIQAEMKRCFAPNICSDSSCRNWTYDVYMCTAEISLSFHERQLAGQNHSDESNLGGLWQCHDCLGLDLYQRNPEQVKRRQHGSLCSANTQGQEQQFFSLWQVDS